MAGYGVPESLEGSPALGMGAGADQQVAQLLADNRTSLMALPHTMVVWGIWLDGAYYFSTSATSRKARNLQQNPALRCMH